MSRVFRLSWNYSKAWYQWLRGINLGQAKDNVVRFSKAQHPVHKQSSSSGQLSLYHTGIAAFYMASLAVAAIAEDIDRKIITYMEKDKKIEKKDH